jgi:hypothetical protein
MTEHQKPEIDPVPLPFPLPPRFAEQLGYRRDRRFVAAYWDAGDEVTVRDDSYLASGLGDWFPWTQFFHRPELRLWRATHNINFGNSDEPATHWLIIDRNTNQGFVAPATEAYKRIKQQRMENVE